MRHVGDESRRCRDHVLGESIEHEANLRADRHFAGDLRRQEESHVDVGEVDDVEHRSADTDHLAWLHHAVLHAAAARRLELAVIDVGLDALDACLRRGHLGFGRGDRRACLHHRSLRRPHLGAGRDHRGFACRHCGRILVELGLGRHLGLGKLSGARELLAVVIEVGQALRHHRFGRRLIGLTLGERAAARLQVALGAFPLRLRLAQLGLEHAGIDLGHDLPFSDEIALIHGDGGDAPGDLGGNVDIGRLDPAVARY